MQGALNKVANEGKAVAVPGATTSPLANVDFDAAYHGSVTNGYERIGPVRTSDSVFPDKSRHDPPQFLTDAIFGCFN
ncbi:MAG: hypothetical protein ACLVEJ_04900 [Parabacteroides sp.]